MTIDQRGDYDLELLAAAFARLEQDEPRRAAEAGLAAAYLAAARRRFYFECVDDDRARAALPFRSAERFLGWLARPARARREAARARGGDQPGRGATRPGAGRRRPRARDQGRARRDHPQLPALPARRRWR